MEQSCYSRKVLRKILSSWIVPGVVPDMYTQGSTLTSSMLITRLITLFLGCWRSYKISRLYNQIQMTQELRLNTAQAEIDVGEIFLWSLEHLRDC